jgi:hypothetical protein
MLFWWIPGEHVWLSVRNVLKVDGRAIPDSQNRLARAMQEPESGGPLSPADAVVARGARSTGNPTHVLLFVVAENQHHFAFTREALERVNGVQAWKVSFAEREMPRVAVIGGIGVPSSGAIWITDEGIVVRTQVTLDAPRRTLKPRREKPDASITVDFRRDPAQDLWLPSRMEERYVTVSCRSTYTNFRRFQAAARLVMPK